MRLKPPRFPTFVVAVALVAAGVVGTRRPIEFVSHHAFWVVVAGFVVLALGNIVDGL